jgi:hypothetical protein
MSRFLPTKRHGREITNTHTHAYTYQQGSGAAPHNIDPSHHRLRHREKDAESTRNAFSPPSHYPSLCSAMTHRDMTEAVTQCASFPPQCSPGALCAPRGEPVRGLRPVTRRNKRPKQGRRFGTPLPPCTSRILRLSNNPYRIVVDSLERSTQTQKDRMSVFLFMG